MVSEQCMYEFGYQNVLVNHAIKMYFITVNSFMGKANYYGTHVVQK